MQTNRRYWIIGGDYEDSRFEAMRPGTQQVIGPFEDMELAERTWRNCADSARSCPENRRYAIAVEPA
jgi:hypothetical protein